jgi:hypothetical protein
MPSFTELLVADRISALHAEAARARLAHAAATTPRSRPGRRHERRAWWGRLGLPALPAGHRA